MGYGFVVVPGRGSRRGDPTLCGRDGRRGWQGWDSDSRRLIERPRGRTCRRQRTNGIVVVRGEACTWNRPAPFRRRIRRVSNPTARFSGRFGPGQRRPNGGGGASGAIASGPKGQKLCYYEYLWISFNWILLVYTYKFRFQTYLKELKVYKII